MNMLTSVNHRIIFFLILCAATACVLPAAWAQNSAIPVDNSIQTEEVTGRSVIDDLAVTDMDVLEVIQLIVHKTALNIVADPNVAGKVTVHLRNVEARDALRIILEPHGLAFAEDNDTLSVMTASDFEQKYGHKFNEQIETKIVSFSFVEPKHVAEGLKPLKSPTGKIFTDTKTNTMVLLDTPAKIAEMLQFISDVDVQRFTMVFELGHAKAADLSVKIQEMLTKTIGRVKFDERSNKLIVTDTAAKIEEIRKLVDAIDQRGRQVVIDVRIISIVLNDEHRQGVDWGAIVSDYHALDFAGTFSSLPSGKKRGTFAIGTIGNDDYAVLLEALDTVGQVEVFANPSVTTVNNKEARIMVGSTLPYATMKDAVDFTDTKTMAAKTNSLDVGVKLFVTPTVHSDGLIAMTIRPETRFSVDNKASANNAGTPEVQSFQAETTVNAKDGVTIVIGGMIKEEKTKTIKKVPFLGDVPFLGAAFRSHSRSIKKTEIVVFLTPKVANRIEEVESRK